MHDKEGLISLYIQNKKICGHADEQHMQNKSSQEMPVNILVRWLWS